MQGFLIAGSVIGVITAIVQVVATIGAMIYIYTSIMPKKFDGTFKNKIMQFLHDYFNFKKLYIESVLKFIFTLATVSCVVGGVVGIFSSILMFFSNLITMSSSYYMTFGVAFGQLIGGIIASIIFAAVGPVVIRLTYEAVMMFIILVKNVMEINSKTKTSVQASEETNI